MKALAPALRSFALAVRSALGAEVRLATEDRRVLEQLILPDYARRADIARVLFVGCASYTRHYAGLFAGREYWTMDPSARRARHGAARHIVDRLERLERHARAGFFDLIVVNGVFGWGLDDRAACEAAFAACHTALRSGGELLIGWNDVRSRRPFPLESIAALGRFRPRHFAPLGASRYLTATPNRHTFDFFVK